MNDLAAQVLAKALQRGVMIACAESCTGGLLAGALTDHPGSSDMFERGFVTYSNAAKTESLGVPPALIETFGAVSEPVAAAMAEGALSRSGARIAIATTGIAGPGGSGHKPEGRVCFAVATKAGVTAETVDFGPLGRAAVRRESVDHALRLLLVALDEFAPVR